MLYPTPFCHILSTFSKEIWWCLLPCPLTNWSQVPAPLITIGVCVENRRICVFLQRAKLRHVRAAICPRRATICYPQICNCLGAFLLSSDVKAVRTIWPVIGKPLILGVAIIGCLRPPVRKNTSPSLCLLIASIASGDSIFLPSADGEHRRCSAAR